jgi:predicted aldo/keto reductase-like oxidoreductase
MEEAMGYVLSLAAVSTLIVGCKTPAEVDENAGIARQFAVFGDERLRELESRTGPNAANFTYYKKPASIFSRRA